MSPVVHTPLSSAAVAVIGLNVEPVGPALWIARLSSGSPPLGFVNALYSAYETGLVKIDGLNVGYEPIA